MYMGKGGRLNCLPLYKFNSNIMRSKKGYPIFGGYPDKLNSIRSTRDIEKQIEYVMAHPEDRSAWRYTSQAEGVGSVNEELGGLLHEKNRTQRILKKLDEIEIAPEVIALRKQLIALFRRYESVICQQDIDGCKEIVFGNDGGYYDFPAQRKREKEGDWQQLNYDKYFDWEHIDLPSEELFQSLEVMPKEVGEVLEEFFPCPNKVSQTDS